MASIREMMMGSWEGRGNAKSAGTHDMPIPGMITSRRVYPKPKAKPYVRPEPKLPIPFPRQKKQKKEKRSRSRGRRRRSPSPLSPGHGARSRNVPGGDLAAVDARSGGALAVGSSAQSSATGSQALPHASGRKNNGDDSSDSEAAEHEAKEEAARKENEERMAKHQAERELRMREEAELAEEQRKKTEQRAADRKKNLKGAFTMEEEGDEEDDRQRLNRELAEKQRAKQQREPLLRPAPVGGEVSRGAVNFALSAPSSGVRGGALTINGFQSLIAPISVAAKDDSESQDAVSLRAALADPAAARAFAPGEVAEKYKLLMDMKRKFRRPEFGGASSGSKDAPRASGSKEAPRAARGRSPSRSRSRKGRGRGKEKERDRSSSRSRYDSMWIRPGGKG